MFNFTADFDLHDENGTQQDLDFDHPEDVIVEVVGPHDDNPDNKNWYNWSIETAVVVNTSAGVIGAASYTQDYGGSLDYAIADIIDVPGNGWFVVEGVTGEFFRGDGWATDDSMNLYYAGVRAATVAEILAHHE